MFTKSKIKSITPIGLGEVWDITVKEDESYLAQGFVNHNSRGPNCQNFTADFREMIIARPNHQLISSDASQFEMRAAAALSQEAYLIDAFKNRYRLLPEVKKLALTYGEPDPDNFVKAVEKGKISILPSEAKLVKEFASFDSHRRTGSLIFDIPPEDVTSVQRTVSKCVSLESIVFTNKGLVKLRSLLPAKPKKGSFYELKGYQVLTDVGFKDSTKVYYAGKLKSFVITTASGRRIVCSDEHKFRVWKNSKYQWVKAKALQEGQDLFLKLGEPVFGKNKAKVENARELGLLMRLAKIIDNKVFISSEQVIKNYSVGLIDRKSGLQEILIAPEELLEVPDWIINGSKEVRQAFFSEFSDVYPGLGWCLSGPEKVLRTCQLILQQYNINGFLKTEANKIVDGKPKLEFFNGNLERFQVLIGNKKKADPEDSDKYFRSAIPSTMYQKVIDGDGLTEKDFEFVEFLKEQNLCRDRIVRIEQGPEVEMGDVHVPENSTVVYNGFVSHNTLSYALLYGAGPPRIQVSLANEGQYLSLDECAALQNKFFTNLPNIKKMIEEIQDSIINKGYVQSFMGRKRYFPLPPKWKTREYIRQKAAFLREATNAPFQMSNADATKLAMVRLEEYYRTFQGMEPTIILNVHDEILIEAHDDIAEEVAKVSQEVFTQACEDSLLGRCPVETSIAISTRWSK